MINHRKKINVVDFSNKIVDYNFSKYLNLNYTKKFYFLIKILIIFILIFFMRLKLLKYLFISLNKFVAPAFRSFKFFYL